MRYPILLLVLVLAVGCDSSESTTSSTAPTKASPIAPGEAIAAETSMSDALVRAKADDANILVIYGSEKCPFSRQMDAQTLSDATVNAALKNFVVLRVEKGVNSADFDQTWGAQPTPSIVTLDPNGQPVGRMVNGVVAKADFLAYAKWARTGEGTQPTVAPGGG